MADNEKKYFDRAWPWYHWHFWPFSGFNNMFTQPLLFDDSLTLLQKVAMLWKKLYDLIQDYEKFKADFATWKAQVESALADLAQAIEDLDARLDTLERCCDEMQEWKDIIDAWKSGLDQWREGVNQDITQINQTITNMGDISALRQTVSNHTQRISTLENNYTTLNQTVTNLGGRVTRLEGDLTTLTQRVSTNEGDIADIKDALSRLDIQLPVNLVDSTNWATVQSSWYDWIAAHCDTVTGHATGTFKSVLALQDEVVPGVISPVTPKQLTVGRLGANIVLCKLPFILTANLTTPTTTGNLAQVLSEVVSICETSGLKGFFVNPLTSLDPYFDATLLTPYPYNIPPSNFHTSYLQFMYGAAPAGQINNMFKISWTPDGNSYTIETAKSIECNVRLQLTKDATTAKLQVSGNELYFAIYNGVVNFYFHAENA